MFDWVRLNSIYELSSNENNWNLVQLGSIYYVAQNGPESIMTTFGERLLESEIHRAFIEYVGHRPDGDNVPGNLNLIPVYSLKSNV